MLAGRPILKNSAGKSHLCLRAVVNIGAAGRREECGGVSSDTELL